ncbi:MAG: hypothetical protein ACK42D_02360 [Candidatus Paceibacteria bacterium]
MGILWYDFSVCNIRHIKEGEGKEVLIIKKEDAQAHELPCYSKGSACPYLGQIAEEDPDVVALRIDYDGRLGDFEVCCHAANGETLRCQECPRKIQ